MACSGSASGSQVIWRFVEEALDRCKDSQSGAKLVIVFVLTFGKAVCDLNGFTSV